MTALRRVLTRRSGEHLDDWFTHIASELLSRQRLVVDNHRLKLRHIEFYYRSDDHPDPFVHGCEIQKSPCRWYFHRVGRGYRGGTRKGVDITFGDGHSLGGILLRAADGEDGTRIQGPSKLVDFLLNAIGEKTVADLDARIGKRRADDPSCPLFLQRQRRSAPIGLIRRRRVGLSMKRATATSGHADYVNRLYFFAAS